MTIEIIMKKTGRGFPLGLFKDRYGEECSIQDSSLAFEDAIWLGVDSVPEGGGRMHLTKSHVRSLLPILEYFVEHGTIEHE